MSYYCSNQHETRPRFSTEARVEAPELWECARCGLPAGQDAENPPEAVKVAPFKTHLAYVKERRSEADGDALLDEALTALRARRSGRPLR